MRLTRTVHGLFTTKETGRKNIVHKLNDMTQKPNHCVSSPVLNTQYIKFSRVEWRRPIKQESWFGYCVFQQIPKFNELHLLFTSAWLSILRRLKQNKPVQAHDSTWLKTSISHFSFSHMLIRGEFPWSIFKKADLTHEKASFYYQYNQLFSKEVLH